MAFNFDSQSVRLRRDKVGQVRTIEHRQAPYFVTEGLVRTPQSIGLAYLADVKDVFGITETALIGTAVPAEVNLSDSIMRLNISTENVGETYCNLFYNQAIYGIPFWRTGINLKVCNAPLSVVGATSNLALNVPVKAPNSKALENFSELSAEQLKKGLGLGKETAVKIDYVSPLYYFIFEADERYQDGHGHEGGEHGGFSHPDMPKLPAVSKSIKDGTAYVVREIWYAYEDEQWGYQNWRAFIEVETGSILQVEVFTSAASGMVFEWDPVTQGSTADVTDNNTTLNPLRTSKTLNNLQNPTAGELTGNLVKIVDPVAEPTNPVNSNPADQPPTEGSPYAFDYNARTGDFAAVNAYYNTDRFMQYMIDLGISLSSQFPNTPLPLSVDHRALNDGINAQGPGTMGGTQSAGIRFGSVTNTTPYLGMATSYRVTLHEFGHVLMYDWVNSPNFGFSHSFGDSLAAIIHDPETNAGDRFSTFPWVNSAGVIADRRHDRDVVAGWAWDGTFDVGGYSSEQILATTLFRVYRSLGGDSSSLWRRNFAAKMTVLLMVKSLQGLTPTTNPSHAEDFAQEMMDTDIAASSPSSLGPVTLGASHKVIRWGFEKQGAYQSMPFGNKEGEAPSVDIYIDDGRDGEYQFQHNHWSCTEIRNQTSPGPSFTHTTPILNQTNYLYVRIKNRGSLTANNIVVKGYRCAPGGGLVWPVDWQSLTTASLNAGSLAPGASKIVGPFLWTPTVQGHECLLFTSLSDNDPNNADTITGNIPEWYLVSHDNNIAQRNVAPAPAFTGGGLVKAFEQYQIFVRNPFEFDIKVTLRAELPDVLARLRWRLEFIGGNAINLPARQHYKKPYEGIQVKMRMYAGQSFDPDDIRKLKETDRDIYVYIDSEYGILGGMTYRLDPELAEYDEITPVRK